MNSFVKHIAVAVSLCALYGATGVSVAQTSTSAGGSAANARAPNSPLAAAQVSRFKLVNGLTVIVKPDHRAPTAINMLWVRVGAMDEVDGLTGVAHVLEHMMFKGTKTLKPGEFSRKVAALGGRENAFTSTDYTGYYQQVPADRLSDVMALEADRFANNQWSDEEFAKELEVVKEERRLRTDDNPRAILREQQSAVTFIASPYRRPIVGWMGDLDSLTANDVREFYKRWYVPENAAVVVVGDVDPQKVYALAKKYYGAIPSRAVPVRKPRDEPVQLGERRIKVKAPAEQAVVSLSFKVPRLNGLEATPTNNDALALTVLAAVLDGYSGARLERALTQGPNRIADGAGAGNGLMGRGPQLFSLSGVPSAGKTVQEVESALREQVALIAREGINEAELARVKTQWVASEIYKLDSVMGQAQELGSLWAQGFQPGDDERLIARLKEVTAAQVQSVAQRYFGDDQLTVGVLVPQPRDPNVKPRVPAPGMRH